MAGIREGVMAIPTPETAHLKILMDKKGRLKAFWRGERLPTTEIHCTQVGMDKRATVALSFIGPCVNLDTEPDEDWV